MYSGSSRQLSASEDFALKDAAVVPRRAGQVGHQRRQPHLDPQVPWAFVVVVADSWGSVAVAAVVATAVAVHLASFAVVAVAGSSSWCSRQKRRWVHPP